MAAIELERLSHTRLDELSVLVEVSAAGSLAGAARRLGIPKSTVGRAVARIERDLGVALVHRQTRGPGLTEQGRMLAQLAAPHVTALRDLTSATAREANEAYGTLRVTAPPDFGALLLGPTIPSFTQRYPGVRVEVELTMRVVDLVREGFDLALRVARRLPSSSLIAKKLAAVEMRLYASASYAAKRELPKRIDALSEHDHVSLATGRDGRSQRQLLTLEGPRGVTKISLPSRVSCNDFYFARELVLSGAGITALPWFVARPELEAGRLVRVLPDQRVEGALSLYLVHPPQIGPSPKLDLFRRHLIDQAPGVLWQP
jgi:DNA-binding transcriptional LysR family regulator